MISVGGRLVVTVGRFFMCVSSTHMCVVVGTAFSTVGGRVMMISVGGRLVVTVGRFFMCVSSTHMCVVVGSDPADPPEPFIFSSISSKSAFSIPWTEAHAVLGTSLPSF